MSKNNLIYIQQRVDDEWWIWKQSTNIDPEPKNTYTAHTRNAAVIHAHNWQQTISTECGVTELLKHVEKVQKCKEWWLIKQSVTGLFGGEYLAYDRKQIFTGPPDPQIHVVEVPTAANAKAALVKRFNSDGDAVNQALLALVDLGVLSK